ncbi:MAG: DUF2244 domain-containing protein [Marinovum sp.]|nr:DUF2244 domain-containing protein [Marinovum sp.]
MPYAWSTSSDTNQELRAWPHQSLPPHGFVLFIGITSCLIVVPLIPLIGSIVLWGILPFILAAVAGIWCALKRSWKDNQIVEVLHFANDHLHLTRHNPRSPTQNWECNAYWAEAILHARGGPVPQYLTLRGNGREVELGAFLSETERRSLYGDLRTKLDALKKPRQS